VRELPLVEEWTRGFMDSTRVQCPYCGEEVEIVFEEDLEGQMVWDCEVCCRPWTVTIYREGDSVRIEAVSSDDA
jgi:transposase-like protein